MVLESYNCVLCRNQIEETLEHLFFYCPFAACCWNFLAFQTSVTLSRLQAVEAFKLAFNQVFFMEVFILLCWSIWSERNDLIFKGLQPSIIKCKVDIKKELTLLCSSFFFFFLTTLCSKVKRSSETAFIQWLNSLQFTSACCCPCTKPGSVPLPFFLCPLRLVSLGPSCL